MIKDIAIEKEIALEDLNVRGFADLVIYTEDNKVYLYDIKSINAWTYRMKFGKAAKANPGSGSIHQELQLATYGIALEREHMKIDGMYILYYNKDTSNMKQIEVHKDRISDAISFWRQQIENHKNGLPPLEEGVSPVMEWECRYCEYLSKCKKDEGDR